MRGGDGCLLLLFIVVLYHVGVQPYVRLLYFLLLVYRYLFIFNNTVINAITYAVNRESLNKLIALNPRQ
jgi:hypothetical protein